MGPAGLGDIFDQLPDAVGIIDTTVTLRAANAAAEQRYGWLREEWIGRSLLELIHPDDLEWALSSLSTVSGREVGTPIELRVKGADGWYLVELVGRSFEYEGEELVVLSARDLTERRRWEVAGDDTAMFRSILHNAASLTLLADEQGTLQAVSAAMIRLTGYGPDATIGRSLTDLVTASHRPRVAAAIAELVGHDAGRTTIEASLVGKDRDDVPCQLTIVNLLNDPTVKGLVISGHDISELWQARNELEHLARHDSLTGLPNRSQLSDELQRRLDESSRQDGDGSGERLIAAFIDLDRFKPVNDLYGHETGDELLVQVADRLRQSARSDDLVARFGGDEFVVVASGEAIDPDELGSRIAKALTTPFHLSVGTVQLSASIGVVTASPGDDADTVLGQADNAMYAVKNDLRDPPAKSKIGSRRRLADRVTEAFELSEFGVHYQPIVDLGTGRWVAFEALARWDHPQAGLLLPGEFVDIVEGIGLGSRLGQVVVERVCRDIAAIGQASGSKPRIAVNASADEVTNPDYASAIIDALRQFEIDPASFTVEISERSILGRGGRTGRVVPANLSALADAGISVAVDDFGTGFSSLTHLVTFPIDRIKIDRSFVAGVVSDSQRRSVIAALIGLARSTGMSVVAEGIDSATQVEALVDLGCELGQGFYFAEPMPYDELLSASLTVNTT